MINVGIIGIGSISEGYGKPDDPLSYCHVGGILYSDRVRLAAIADLDPVRRTGFKEKWGDRFPDLTYFDSAEGMLKDTKLDVVSVCVRGPMHHQVMIDVIKAGPRAIFLEKPPTCSLGEMDAILNLASEDHIPITVSYSRHWSPHVLRLQELVQNEDLIGEVQTVIGYVGGTFLSFASHTTDLICQFAGYDPLSVVAQGHYRSEEFIPDGYEGEPVIDGTLIEFKSGKKGIHIGADGAHGGFCCEVIGSKGMVRAGIYIPPFACDTDKNPIDLSKYDIPEDRSVFTIAYNQIAAYLEGGPLPHCTNDQFKTVHEIGFASIESMITGKRIEIPTTNRTRKIYANG
jgi:predicted dehydrogenase